MNQETRSDVPPLDTANYGPWLIALRAAACNHDAITHLEGDPPLPANEETIHEHNKKKNYLLGKIITTLPRDLANLLIQPDTEPTPYALVTTIKAHLNTTNANDHRYLKSLAESTRFLPEMMLSKYVTGHEKIRARMIASQYPNIADPKVTVEFMIEGLRQNPATAPIGLQLIALQPKDLKDFTHQFNRIQSYQEVTSTVPQAHGLPSAAPRDIQEILRLLRRSNRPKRDPYTRYDFKPCKVHINKGVTNPRHTDEQCRDPEHPRHRKQRRAPRAAAARAAQPTDLAAIAAQIQEMVAPNATATDDDDTDSTFLLDSAAHPTHTYPRSTVSND